MEAPLLQTKLHVPTARPDSATGRRSSLIPRPRLIERLDEGLPGKLTLISAPAGFGKTTLVSAWLDHVNLPLAWLSLDEDDNDFARFLTYLIAALQAIRPEVGREVLALLHSSPLPHSHSLLTLLINDLMAVPEKSILVLDDYHAIEAAAIDQALTYFIDHIPPLMHLVIISRADPSVSLSRLRANGELNELRSADLRFTPTETAQFLKQATDLVFTAADVAALDSRIEGWIAGLQMTALSLRQRGAAAMAQFIEDFSGSQRYIMDYLVDEVLQKQPAEVQTFLLYTSILDRLCGPLCDAILKDEGGRTLAPALALDASAGVKDETGSPLLILHPSSLILEHLERSNLFLHPLDDQHTWYRYHPLFADLLRQRLHQIHRDRAAALHLSASQWYEGAGFTGPAVRHALAAKAFDRAAALVEQAAPAMIQRSEFANLLGWFEALPEAEVQARPLLALYFGWDLFLSGQIKQAAARLQAVETMLAADKSRLTPEVQAHIAAMRAYLERETGDLASTIALSRQALSHLPAHNSLLRAMVTLNQAIAHYLQGELELASQLLTEDIAAGQTAQLMANTLSAIYFNTRILRAQGALQQALQLCHEGLDLVARNNWQNFPAAGFLYVAYGDLLRERNELTTAAEYLERGIRLGQAGAHPHIMIIGHVWLSWLRQTIGDVTGSHESIQAALQVIQQHEVSRFWPLPSAASYQARLWIAQGNLAAASRWAQSSGLHPADRPVTFLDEADYLTLARLLIAQGNLEAAETLLFQLQQAAASAGRNGSLIEILIQQSLTFAAQNRGEAALSALDQAFSLAEPEGYVRIFLDEGAPMAELLRRAVTQDLHARYALQLLAAMGETVSLPQSQVESLSERELEVLRRVAAGYSNQEIAQDLVVAVSTVKKHINNIYGKLGVRSRTQAVARAREVGIL